jgi:hypothetical protein
LSDYNLRLPEFCKHESTLIAGTVCNGCKRLDIVIERKRGRYGAYEHEKYYCRDIQRGYFDPSTVDDCGLRLIEGGDDGR